MARVSADHLQLHRLLQAILLSRAGSEQGGDKMGAVVLRLLRETVPVEDQLPGDRQDPATTRRRDDAAAPYGADVEHVDRMASLAARADQGTWWAPFGDVLPNWFKTFVGLEGLAASEFTYESLLLPGQLQTPDYGAALLVGNLRVPPMEASQVVRARMACQRLADETDPLRFRAVIEE